MIVLGCVSGVVKQVELCCIISMLCLFVFLEFASVCESFFELDLISLLFASFLMDKPKDLFH